MKPNAPRPSAPPLLALQELLRTSGLRSTAARLAVLGYLHETHTPNSHAQMFEALGDRGFDRATIYRNLMDLAEAGIVRRTDLGDHVWRFELVRGVAGSRHTDEHPHFVCLDCGDVVCLPGLSLEIRGAGGAPRSVGEKRITVQLKGLCDACS